MAINYKVSNDTAAMADALQLLYKFYEEFYNLVCAVNIGQKGIKALEESYQALADTAEMLIGWHIGGRLLDEENAKQLQPEL